MLNSNVLVIAVDGLRAAALGAYGNTAYPTPALDQFAAESFLFDECFANATQLASIYRALWTASHPFRDATPSVTADAASLPRWLADNGYATTLVTDEPAIAALPAASEFDECVSIAEAAFARADAVAATRLARLFAAVSEHVQPMPGDRDARQFVWVHARGMYGPWDAPLELQESLVEREEGDPSPCDAIEPPEVMLDAESDPDAIFRASCGYAAQVIVLDACVEGLLRLLDDVPSRDRWLTVLCGVRGFPLGEHGRIGGVDERLFAEQLHVPLLWRFPDGSGRLARSRELASHLDVLPTLLDWIGSCAERGLCADRGLCAGLTTPHQPWHGQETGHNDGLSLLPLIRRIGPPWREALVAAGTSSCRSIRTAEWSLRCEPAVGDDPPPVDAWKRELYVRPDDRWEANDVANLCPDEVDGLSKLLLG